MRERPILFSGAVVRAILDGTKTQTRRVVKPQPDFANEGIAAVFTPDDQRLGRLGKVIPCPYGQPGDRLWVRETWQHYDWTEDGEPCIRFAADNTTSWPEVRGDGDWERLVERWEILSRSENYDIDNRARDRKWRPSIFMPRWASRITLEITDVRVQRLQEIDGPDAWAEGIPHSPDVNPVHEYEELWQSINAKRAPWASNPWVWCISFKRIEATTPDGGGEE